MKKFKFESFTVSTMGSYWDTYYSEGNTLKESKAKLVKQLGCTDTYFDNPEYSKITEL